MSIRQPGTKKELVLVVDCSGSMSGSPIQYAKDAALFFVRDLPVGAGIKFQIVLFGTRHKQMNAASQDYEVESERRAVDWITAHVEADLGGTEIYDTLRMVYDTPIPEGYERQIMFMTDGGAALQEKAIEELLQSHVQAAKTTVLTLGIGYGVQRGLVDMMAAATGGLSQYVSSARDIVHTCSFLKKCALSEDVLLQPRLKPKLCMLRSAPAVLPPRLFAGEQLLLLTGVLKAEEGAALELQAVRRSGEEVCVSVPIPGPAEDLASTAARAGAGTQVYQLEGDAIAALHAMVCIKSLLSGTSALHLEPDGTPVKRLIPQEVIKDQVVKLATEEGLVTPYTSAVGVLLLADPKDPSKTQQMEVPLKLPEGRSMCCSTPYGSTEFSLPAPQSHPGSAGSANPGSDAARAYYEQMLQAAKQMVKECVSQLPSTGAAAMPFEVGTKEAAPASAGEPCRQPPCSAPFRLGSARWSPFSNLRHTWDSAEQGARECTSELELHLVGASASRSEMGTQVTTVLTSDGEHSKLPTEEETSKALQGAGSSQAPTYGSSDASQARVERGSSRGVAFGELTGYSEEGVGAKQSPRPSWLQKDLFSELSCFENTLKAPPTPALSESKQKTTTQPAPLPSTATQEPPVPSAAPAEAPTPPPPLAAPASAVPGPQTRPSNPTEMLRSLNLSRTIEGYWQTGDSLLEDLLAQRAAREGGKEVKELVAQVKAAKPAALPEDMWTTVLVLAYLRQHLSQQRPQWEGMEAKALAWLQAHWPQDGVQSVGSCVLSAMKLV